MRWQRAVSLSIQFDTDDPSAIGRILSRLGVAGVRIDGNAKSGNALRVLTSDLSIARDIIRDLGLTFQESDVVVIDLPEETGAIARVLEDVAAAGLAITFMYAATQGRIVIGAPDLDGLLAVLMKGSEHREPKR
jgi:hypothetical protein